MIVNTLFNEVPFRIHKESPPTAGFNQQSNNYHLHTQSCKGAIYACNSLHSQRKGQSFDKFKRNLCLEKRFSLQKFCLIFSLQRPDQLFMQTLTKKWNLQLSALKVYCWQTILTYCLYWSLVLSSSCHHHCCAYNIQNKRLTCMYLQTTQDFRWNWKLQNDI